MDWPTVILLIVIIGAVTSTIQTRMTDCKERRPSDRRTDSRDALAMQDEVLSLRERVAVLERIATDKNNLLEQEFERLRGR